MTSENFVESWSLAIWVGSESMKAPSDGEARQCRREFQIMTWTVAVNHAAVTTPILYASSVLSNASGQAGNAVLYGTTLICSLFFSTLIFGMLGAKRGLSISMGLYSVYVLLFALAASMCDERHASNGSCIKGSQYQLHVNLLGLRAWFPCLFHAFLILVSMPFSCLFDPFWQLPGAFVGGIGAGILWTCQGTFFSSVCERVAAVPS